ncbi:hypothetical protein B0H11DRAFT_1922375 [Mycena galericulata]|nr:hypothetical protein B0H11DRAFT_1922375 [Mycena galericulata]
MSSSVTWPFSIVTQIHMSLPGEPSLFSPSQSIQAFVSGAGLSHVSIRFQDIQNSISFTMLSVDTLDADIDRTTRSWSISTSSWECPRQLAQLPIRIVLDFVTHKQFDCFLFALSYVRFIDGRSSLGIFSPNLGQARDIVVADTDGASSVETLSQHFVSMRGAPGDKCSVHTLPVELISLIFLHCASSDNHRDRIATPLLLLRICSFWRAIAVQTAELWRKPSLALGPSYLADRDNYHLQVASWLTRAKSSPITLYLVLAADEQLPHETFDLAVHHPSLFGRVQTLHISSPQSQLCNLLGGAGGPAMSLLESVSLVISSWDLRSWPSGVQFCGSAPLLSHLKIEAGRFASSMRLNPGFAQAFPWSQLTTLIMQMDLGISIWISVFSQCTSLVTGRFIVWNDGIDVRTPFTLLHLTSLRVTFRHFCHTRFFEHFAFPAIQHLHLAGIMPSTIQPQTAAFIPQLTTLRTLILDIVELPLPLLCTLIRSNPKLEQLGFFVDDDSGQYAPLFRQLQQDYRLRTLTIALGDAVEDQALFAKHATTWAIQQASATDSEFRLLGSLDILQVVVAALAHVVAVKVSIDANFEADDFYDPFAISPYSRERFLSVRRR